MFCRNCGNLVEESDQVCPHCGSVDPAAAIPAGKSKAVAGILGILLGSLGIHNFYLGYTGKGVAQLLITLISLGTLSFISSIWGIVEGIMILCGSINADAKGNPLT